MADQAVRDGVCGADILREENSRNTRENFQNSLTLLQQSTDGARLSINIVAIAFHARRALITARDVFPAGTRFGVACYPSLYYANAEWHLSVRGRKDVQGEISKLNRYFPGSVPEHILRKSEKISP